MAEGGQWRQIRCFISSTFRDTHGERDMLTRKVFPRLREWAQQYFVQVTEIDLRWGVTEEESSSGKAVMLCLEEIDRCNTFIGILGSRYGWTPDTYDVPNTSKYDWVREYPAGHSITELEIYRAALNLGKKRTHTVKRAMFYYRREDFLRDVPEVQKLNWCDGELVAPQKGMPKVFVQDPVKRKLLEELMEKIRAHARSHPDLVKVRKPYWCRFKPPEMTAIGAEKVLVQDLEEWGEWVYEDMKDAILRCYPPSDKPMDPLTYQRMQHSLFADHHSGKLIGREDVVQRVFRRTVDFHNRKKQGLVVCGEPGVGKTGVMGALLKLLEKRQKTDVARRKDTSGPAAGAGADGSGAGASQWNMVIIAHFVGSCSGSDDLRQILQRFCLELRVGYRNAQKTLSKGQRAKIAAQKHAKLDADEQKANVWLNDPTDSPPPGDIKVLRKMFLALVKMVCTYTRVVLLMDGLDQLRSNNRAKTLDWLPSLAQLPSKMKMVLSANVVGEHNQDDMCLDILRRRGCLQTKVKRLAKPDAEKVLAGLLGQYGKKLDNRQVENMFTRKEARMPLYLTVTAEELRVFELYEGVMQRINELPESLAELFMQLLRRLESDHGPNLVRDTMCFVLLAREGLNEDEVQALTTMTLAQWTTLRLSLLPYLRHDGGSSSLITFTVRQITEAAIIKYFVDDDPMNAPAGVSGASFAQGSARGPGGVKGALSGASVMSVSGMRSVINQHTGARSSPGIETFDSIALETDSEASSTSESEGGDDDGGSDAGGSIDSMAMAVTDSDEEEDAVSKLKNPLDNALKEYEHVFHMRLAAFCRARARGKNCAEAAAASTMTALGLKQVEPDPEDSRSTVARRKSGTGFTGLARRHVVPTGEDLKKAANATSDAPKGLVKASDFSDWVRTWSTASPDAVRALRALPYHLIRAMKVKEACEVLCDLQYIEAMSRVGFPYEVVDNLLQVRSMLKYATKQKMRLVMAAETAKAYDAAAGQLMGSPKRGAAGSGIRGAAAMALQTLAEGSQGGGGSHFTFSPEALEASAKAAAGGASTVMTNYGPVKTPHGGGASFMMQDDKSSHGGGAISVQSAGGHRHLIDVVGSVVSQIHLKREARVSAALRFVQAKAHVLTKHPHLAFQSARNLPDSNPLVDHAVNEWTNGFESRPYLRWINKPQHRSACIMTLSGHADVVTDVQYSPDGTILASGCMDGKIRIWDTMTGDLSKTLPAQAPVTCLSFCPDDSRWLVVGLADGKVQLWDYRAGLMKEVRRVPSIMLRPASQGSDMSPNGSRRGSTMSVADDGAATVFSAGGPTGAEESRPVTSMGEADAEAKDKGEGAGESKGAEEAKGEAADKIAWEGSAKDAALAAALTTKPMTPQGMISDKFVRRRGSKIVIGHQAHKSEVTAVSWNQRGTYFATGDKDGNVIVWDCTVQNVWNLGDSRCQPRVSRMWKAHREAVRHIVFTPRRFKPQDNLSKTGAQVAFGAEGQVSDAEDNDNEASGAEDGDEDMNASDVEGHSPRSRTRTLSGDEDPGSAKRGVRFADEPGEPKRGVRFADGDDGAGGGVSKGTIGMAADAPTSGGFSRKKPGRATAKSRPSPLSASKRRHPFDEVGILVTAGGTLVSMWNAEWEDDYVAPHMRTAEAVAAARAERARVRAERLKRGAAAASLEDLDSDEEDGGVENVGGVSGESIGARTFEGKMLILVRNSNMDLKLLSTEELAGKINLREDTGMMAVRAALSNRQRLAVGGADGQVRVYKTETGRRVAMLSGHIGVVTSCTYSHDGRRIASAGEDGTVRVWVPALLSSKSVGVGHKTGVVGATFSSKMTNKQVATGAQDGSVKLWLTNQTRPFFKIQARAKNLQSLAFSPNNNILISASVAGIRTWTIDITNPASPPFRDITTSAVGSWRLAPTGNTLAVTTDVEGINGVTVLGVESGKWIGAFAPSHDTDDPAVSAIRSIFFSPDARLLIVNSENGYAKIWDVGALPKNSQATANAIQMAKVCDEKPVITLIDTTASTTAETLVNHCAFAPNGKQLMCVVASPRIKLWNIPQAISARDEQLITGELVPIENYLKQLSGHTARVRHAAWSPDGRSVLSGGSDGKLLLWDIQSTDVRCELGGHDGKPINYVAITSNGARMISAGMDHTVRLWDRDGSPLSTWLQDAAISVVCPDAIGNEIVVGDDTGGVAILALEGDKAGAKADPIVTVTRIFYAERHMWNPKLTVQCFRCGHRYSPTTAAISTARGIQRNLETYGPLPHFFEDPRLRTTCSSCKATMRLNPFVVENPLMLGEDVDQAAAAQAIQARKARENAAALSVGSTAAGRSRYGNTRGTKGITRGTKGITRGRTRGMGGLASALGGRPGDGKDDGKGAAKTIPMGTMLATSKAAGVFKRNLERAEIRIGDAPPGVDPYAHRKAAAQRWGFDDEPKRRVVAPIPRPLIKEREPVKRVKAKPPSHNLPFLRQPKHAKQVVKQRAPKPQAPPPAPENPGGLPMPHPGLVKTVVQAAAQQAQESGADNKLAALGGGFSETHTVKVRLGASYDGRNASVQMVGVDAPGLKVGVLKNSPSSKRLSAGTDGASHAHRGSRPASVRFADALSPDGRDGPSSPATSAPASRQGPVPTRPLPSPGAGSTHSGAPRTPKGRVVKPPPVPGATPSPARSPMRAAKSPKTPTRVSFNVARRSFDGDG